MSRQKRGRFPRGASKEAEIKPVEPGQGNACEGKE